MRAFDGCVNHIAASWALCVRARTCVQGKMKGKNKPSRRHRKKQVNIIEERKPTMKQRMQEQVGVWPSRAELKSHEGLNSNTNCS
jgi:U3 small nucleolar RNA-associated protein 7